MQGDRFHYKQSRSTQVRTYHQGNIQVNRLSRKDTGRRHPPAIQEKGFIRKPYWGFPAGAVVENPPANAEDTGEDPKCRGATKPVHHY